METIIIAIVAKNFSQFKLIQITTQEMLNALTTFSIKKDTI